MKITPEIKKFIYDNKSLSGRKLSALIETKFNIKISYVSIEPHLQKARIEAEAENIAKIEAIRSKILGDADTYAAKYLKILDEEIDAWYEILKASRDIKIEDIKDRQAASQTLQKYINSIIEFAKPPEKQDINITIPDSLDKRIAKYKDYFKDLEDGNESKSKGIAGGNGSG
jgi:inorganic pyrophosphatase